MGSVTGTATAFPGNTGQRTDGGAALAEMLRLARGGLATLYVNERKSAEKQRRLVGKRLRAGSTRSDRIGILERDPSTPTVK